MFMHPKRFLINPVNRGFWWGVGTVGLAWIFRNQLRPIAVQGAKGLIYVTDGIKNAFYASSEGAKDIVVDAQTNRMRGKLEALKLSNKELSFIRTEVGKLTKQLEIINKVMTEKVTKEKKD